MKKDILTLILLLLSTLAFAQIEGRWKTYDDKTKQEKSIVEIYKKSDGQYYGKIVHLKQKPKNNTCIKCSDDRKNQPLIGLEIIRNLKKENDEFTGGSILDPASGKVYKCTIKKNGNQLDVRGYIGFSLIGRTQTWVKAE